MSFSSCAKDPSDVADLVFSPSGQRLASTSVYGTVKVWDVDTHRCIYEYTPDAPISPSFRVAGVAFCTSAGPESLIAIACQELSSSTQTDKILIIDINLGQPIKTIQRALTTTFHLALSPNAQFLACVSFKKFQVWNVNAQEQENPLTLREDLWYPHRVAFSNDGHLLACFGSEGKLSMWSTETMTLEMDLHLNAKLSYKTRDVRLLMLMFSKDDASIFVGTWRILIKVDVKTGTPSTLLTTPLFSPYNGAFEMEAFMLSCPFKPLFKENAQCYAISPDGCLVVVGYANGEVRVEAGMDHRALLVFMQQKGPAKTFLEKDGDTACVRKVFKWLVN